MNRQAVPSIFLSIANVCFFAVILYHREPQAKSSAVSEPATSDATRSPREHSSAANLAGGAAIASLSTATEAMPRMPAIAGRPPDPARRIAEAIGREAEDRPVLTER